MQVGNIVHGLLSNFFLSSERNQGEIVTGCRRLDTGNAGGMIEIKGVARRQPTDKQELKRSGAESANALEAEDRFRLSKLLPEGRGYLVSEIDAGSAK